MTTPPSTTTTNPPLPRSPSPSPAPPQPQAPGPRATALQKVFNDALAHTLRACSYTNFSACFPTPAAYVPGALDGLHRDFVERLGEVCKKEFANLMEERQVLPSLNELDQLISDAKRRKDRAEAAAEEGQGLPPTPPYLLPPSQLLAAHLAPFLNSQHTTLTSSLSQLQRDNAGLISEIEAQRREMAELVAGLEDVVRDLEGAGKVLGGDEMEGVENDIEEAWKVVKRSGVGVGAGV